MSSVEAYMLNGMAELTALCLFIRLWYSHWTRAKPHENEICEMIIYMFGVGLQTSLLSVFLPQLLLQINQSERKTAEGWKPDNSLAHLTHQNAHPFQQCALINESHTEYEELCVIFRSLVWTCGFLTSFLCQLVFRTSFSPCFSPVVRLCSEIR